MPCYDPRDHFDYEDMQTERRKMQDKLDKLTRMLCKICNEVPAASNVDAEIQEWFGQHKAFDDSRLAKEPK